MFHIAVVEDEEESRELLRRYLEKYRKEKGTELEMTFFRDGLELTENYRPIYQILLLDIEMPHMDGLTAARFVRQADEEVVIIFITNMARYAIRGYEVQALDFVLKPVSYFAFSMKLEKALAKVASRKQESLMLPTEEGFRRVQTEDITFMEVVSHRLLVHTTTETYSSRETLNRMEELLKNRNFVRCNKGYLVNLRQVSLVKKDSVVVGGQELLISRRRKEEFLKALMDFYGGGQAG